MIKSLGPHAAGIDAKPEPAPVERVPGWIRNGLLNAGVALEEIEAMDHETALQELQQRWSSPEQ